jgi:hypothetical protein
VKKGVGRASLSIEGHRVKTLTVLVVLAIIWTPLSSCRQTTDEDLILDMFDKLAGLAEKKDIGVMMTFFADDFADFEGRDKSGLRELLSDYVRGRMGIVVHRLGSRVEDLVAGRATLRTDIALSSGGAEALRRLVRISPDIYRLRVELVKNAGSWRVRFAEWSGISLGELFPESVSALRELFPNLF